MMKFQKKSIFTSSIFFSFVLGLFVLPLTVNAQRATTPGAFCLSSAECMVGEFCDINTCRLISNRCTTNLNCSGAQSFCDTGTGYCSSIQPTPIPTVTNPGEPPVITPTPYTGGNPPSGVGNVTTPGYCGGDPNLFWDYSAKMCLPKTDQCTEGSIACSKSLSELVVKIINYLLIFAGMIAVLAVIIGGFWYITAAGNEEQSEKGKKAIINAIIGIVVITLAFLIIRVISHTLTSGSV